MHYIQINKILHPKKHTNNIIYLIRQSMHTRINNEIQDALTMLENILTAKSNDICDWSTICTALECKEWRGFPSTEAVRNGTCNISKLQ